MIMYFAGVFGVYLKERAQVRSEGLPWIPNKATIELTQPGMVIWTLLISIVVMQWAVYSIKHDDRQHALLGIGTTLVMGAMVVVQTAWHLSQTNLIADEGPTTAATLIFTIVGSYLVAVIIGMIILLLTGFRTMAGHVRKHTNRRCCRCFTVLVLTGLHILHHLDCRLHSEMRRGR